MRPYQPGDDVRTIDWNRTARMGTPFVKQFVEERDLTVFLAVDVSGSLRFGSRAILKRELAAEIAALLAFAALRNQDRVGAALPDRPAGALPAAAAAAQPACCGWCTRSWRGPPAAAPTSTRALGAALSNLRQRSVLFLISDFVGAGPRARAAARRRAPRRGRRRARRSARSRAAAVRPGRARATPRPARSPWSTAGASRAEAAARAAAERAALHQLLIARLGVDHLELRTDRPYLPELVAFFERRKRRYRTARKPR